MNVLSLFDGISCGQQALKELGIPVDKYYASEIDKYAISITQMNFPETIQLGDIEQWEQWDDAMKDNDTAVESTAMTQSSATHDAVDWSKIDLIQGGSPCQGFSFAGKQLNFDDPRSKLFFTFVDILNHARKHNPDVKFLLENVRMKQEYQDIISEALGVKPVMINSALMSAQNRVRLYWTNITEIQQPEDRGIMLKDILEDDATEPMYSNIYGGFKEKKPRIHRDKSVTIRTASGGGHIPSVTLKDNVIRVPEATKKGYTEAKAGEGLDLTFPNSKTRRGRLMKHKSNCLTAGNHEMGVVREKSKCVRSSGRGSYDRHEWDSVGNKGTELHWRKLTPLECERLQTLPDNYTAQGDTDIGVAIISNTQRYKALGNGWTVAVIKHIYDSLK